MPDVSRACARLLEAIRAVERARTVAHARFDEHTAAEGRESELLGRYGTPRTDAGGQAVRPLEPDHPPPDYVSARKAVEDTDKACIAAWSRLDTAALALLRVPAHDLAEARLKLAVYAWAYEAHDPAQLPFDTELSAALAALLRDVAALTPQSGAEGARWREAKDRYEAAHAAYRDVVEADSEAYVSLFDEVPPSLVEPCACYRLHLRWTSVEALKDDVLLSDGEKAEIEPRLSHWLGWLDGRRKVDRGLAEDDPADALYDAQADAFDELMATAAPDAAALACKHALEARDRDDDHLGFDDLGRVAFMRHGGREASFQVQTYIDALRLAGLDAPLLHMEDFSPGFWVRRFERLGGAVCGGAQQLLIVHGPRADRLDRAAAAELLAELDATPWKYRALALYAGDRREDGGDPLFDAYGNWGPKDRRGGKRAGPELPLRRVDRVTFRREKDAVVPTVQRLERRGGRLVAVE